MLTSYKPDSLGGREKKEEKGEEKEEEEEGRGGSPKILLTGWFFSKDVLRHTNPSRPSMKMWCHELEFGKRSISS